MRQPEEESIPWGRIKALLLDSDGVLTDGGVYLPEEDGPETRRFDIKDGFGITRLLGTGFPIAVISRSPSVPVKTRCQRLGIEHAFVGVKDKVACAEGFLREQGVDWEAAAFMGDDVPDLPLMKRVGFSFAPEDASEEVLEAVSWVSSRPGGYGAVREVCDRIYRARRNDTKDDESPLVWEKNLPYS